MTLVRGVAITGLSQGWRVAISLLSGILMTRLLRPEDFGLIALITPAVALIGLVQDLGLNQSTIQRERVTNEQVSGLFYLTLAISTTLGVCLALSGPALAAFFEEPRLVDLAIAFGGLVVVWSSQSQPMALLARNMRFGAMAMVDVVSVTAGFVVGVTVAYVFRSHWAIFAAMLTTGALGAGGAFLASGFRPGRVDFAGDFKALVGFGSSVSAFNVFNFLSRNADNLLIGRVHGVVELGLYDRAYKLLLFPLQQICNPLNRVMVPFLSRSRNDPQRYRDGYITCITVLMVLTQPGVLVATVFAQDVFLVLLGERWVPASSIFFWLGIAGLQQVFIGTLSWIFLSQGRGRDFLVLGALQCVLTLTAFVVGLSDGALGVARAYAIADTAIKAPLACVLALRVGPVSVPRFLLAVVPHAVALALALLALLFVASAVETASFGSLAGLTVLSYLVYGAALLPWPRKRALALDVVRRVRPAWALRPAPPARLSLKEPT